jgi:hypothetical protein
MTVEGDDQTHGLPRELCSLNKRKAQRKMRPEEKLRDSCL